MKLFVRSDWWVFAFVVLAPTLVVAVTGAGVGATYLIMVAFLAIAIVWRSQHEPPEDSES